MAHTIRRVEYFHATVVDQPGEAYKVLSALAGLGVDLLAFTTVPVGPDRTQLTLFPADPAKMASEADRALNRLSSNARIPREVRDELARTRQLVKERSAMPDRPECR